MVIAGPFICMSLFAVEGATKTSDRGCQPGRAAHSAHPSHNPQFEFGAFGHKEILSP